MTPAPPTSAAPPAAPAGPSLGQTAARGFSWMVAQTLALKVISVLSQIALGKLLLKEDFGLIGLAYVVTSFAALIQEAGITQILVHRHRHFRRWANAAFWMSMALGGASAAIAAAAPLAARAYGSPPLAKLLALLAIAPLLNAAAVVPNAKLQAALRFRFLASLGAVVALLTALLTVLLAWLGFGAYSLVLPAVLLALPRALLLWWVAGERVRLDVQWSRWRYLVGDSGRLLATSFFANITMQGDNLTLGLVAGKAVVGVYYFAFTLAMQATVLLTGSLMGVLFPALSTLQHDPRRQREAFLRAARLLALVGVPLCLLQAALAGPLLRLLFGDKWLAAIPLVQLMSAATGCQVVNGAAYSLIQAQGRFHVLLRVTASFAAVFLAMVIPGAIYGQAFGTTLGACGAAVVTSVVLPYVALRPTESRPRDAARDVARLYAIPWFVGGAGTLAACAAAALVPAALPHRDAVLVPLILLVAGGGYAAVAWLAAPDLCRDLIARLAGLRRRASSAAAVAVPTGVNPESALPS